MRSTRDRSDAALLAATRSGGEAFGAFYRRHEPSVLGYFLHWSRSPEVAADLTAETFASAFESLSTFRPDRGEPRAWLFGIARHVLARSVERGRVENDARERLGMPTLVVSDDALERIESLASLDGVAIDLLNELPAPVRAAVAGRVVQEREYRDLAQALQCSESVVRQRVHRGLALLRNRMEVSS